MCCAVAGPSVPMETVPGLAFASRTTSASDVYGLVAPVATTCGEFTMLATGSNARMPS